MRSPVVSLRRDLVRLKSAKSFEALLVELDHLLRGTGSKARSAGEVLAPFGLLREAVLVEGEENLLLVRTKTPEASRAVAELLPRALQGSPLERYLPFPVGPEPGGEGEALPDPRPEAPRSGSRSPSRSRGVRHVVERERDHLTDILTSRGWYEAFRLATLQASLTLQAVPRLEGKKRFAFAPLPIPEALKKIASGVRITPEALSLFFPENSE